MAGPKKRRSLQDSGEADTDDIMPPPPPGVFVKSHQVPPECREPYQLGGYRYPNYQATQCLRSLFQLHNETFNCWTHIPAVVYFLYKGMVILNDMSKGRLEAAEYLPLLLWTFGCCVLFAGSSIAHTFNCISVKCRKRVFLLDYSAISFCASGTSLAYCTFLPESVMLFGSKDGYLLTCALLSWLGIIGCSLALVKFAGTSISPPLKVFSFGLITVGGNIPMFIYALQTEPLPQDEREIRHNIVLVFYVYLFCMVMGGVINGSCCPERCRPGRFDVLGHSHQLFHILIFAAFALQYEMIYMVRDYGGTKPGRADMVRACLLALVAWPVYCVTTICFAYFCNDNEKLKRSNNTQPKSIIRVNFI